MMKLILNSLSFILKKTDLYPTNDLFITTIDGVTYSIFNKLTFQL